MSVEALRWAISQDVGSVTAKSALMCLAWHHNASNGLCCPSLATLKKEMNAGSHNTVKTALKTLETHGLITQSKEFRDGTKCIARTAFSLHMSIVDTPVSKADTGVSYSGSGVSDTDRGVCQSMTQVCQQLTPIRNKEKEKKEKRAPESTSAPKAQIPLDKLAYTDLNKSTAFSLAKVISQRADLLAELPECYFEAGAFNADKFAISIYGSSDVFSEYKWLFSKLQPSA